MEIIELIIGIPAALLIMWLIYLTYQHTFKKHMESDKQ